MASISSTFNDLANQQAFLLVLLIWISVSLDAEKKEAKAKKRRIASNIAEKPKTAPLKPTPTGFR